MLSLLNRSSWIFSLFWTFDKPVIQSLCSIAVLAEKRTENRRKVFFQLQKQNLFMPDIFSGCCFWVSSLVFLIHYSKQMTSKRRSTNETPLTAGFEYNLFSLKLQKIQRKLLRNMSWWCSIHFLFIITENTLKVPVTLGRFMSDLIFFKFTSGKKTHWNNGTHTWYPVLQPDMAFLKECRNGGFRKYPLSHLWNANNEEMHSWL